jgi:hypothetical protein
MWLQRKQGVGTAHATYFSGFSQADTQQKCCMRTKTRNKINRLIDVAALFAVAR